MKKEHKYDIKYKTHVTCILTTTKLLTVSFNGTTKHIVMDKLLDIDLSILHEVLHRANPKQLSSALNSAQMDWFNNSWHYPT